MTEPDVLIDLHPEDVRAEAFETSSLDARIARLKNAVQCAPPGVCAERALIWTKYFKDAKNRRKSPHIRAAEALSSVLAEMKIQIFADELLVGNYTSHRVGGAIYPELVGPAVIPELFGIAKRKINPLSLDDAEKWRLLRILPFWARRFLPYRAFPTLAKSVGFIASQIEATHHVINESSGIAHVAPDYPKLLRVGLKGIFDEASEHQNRCAEGSEPWAFYEGVRTMAKGVAAFAQRYSALARSMADGETDVARRRELLSISKVTARVPWEPATTLQEALQSILFVQIGINLESLDNGISPGRMDQYLLPYFEAETQGDGEERARGLLAAFCIKTSELIPVFSAYVTRVHSGLMSGQVVTVGGVDEDGADATNPLSYLFVRVIDELRMRQPNFHARIHPGTPEAFVTRVLEVLAAGAASPALFNDTAIIDAMTRRGYSLADARDYTAIGCVEPASQGRSFASTDAALVNVPLLLELALNEGRRFGSRRRVGAATPPPAQLLSMADIKRAFERQLQHELDRLHTELSAVERANRDVHPTPLTSLMLEGCLASGRCSTAGGAKYNFSGIQCVGVTDVGDSLYAIERAVFVEQKISLVELIGSLKSDFKKLPELRDTLRSFAKFGNDREEVDAYTRYVIERFDEGLSNFTNERGGKYLCGVYSMTAHQYFGEIAGASASGRKKGEPFASGLAPGLGFDREGPTALINSMNRIDFARTPNGINFNLKFDGDSLRGEVGLAALRSLVRTYFRRGGMQMQINVLDREILQRAKASWRDYPHLLVRVSGYCAYFADLSPEVQDEIIARTSLRAGGSTWA